MAITKKKITGAVIAAAAAGLLAIAPVTSTLAGSGMHMGGKVHCYGVNGCKGMGSCKTAKNACKGQNSCKGHGFVSVSKKICKQIAGTVKDE